MTPLGPEGCEAYAEVFVGKLPPFWLLDWQVQSLFSVVELPRVQVEHEQGGHLYIDVLRHAKEVALIGTVGYFEAFCKHQFAALVNIHPALLEAFAANRPQAVLRLSEIASLFQRFDTEIGFVVAEQNDFGSARMINALFRDLLGVTPLSHDEGDRFDRILNMRHLLVHHAGIYTRAYARGTATSQSGGEPFRDKVEVPVEELHEMTEFVMRMAIKISVTTVEALKNRTDGLARIRAERRGAVNLLLQGVWDEISL